MHLTQLLLRTRFNPFDNLGRRIPIGFKYRGKNREYRKITFKHMTDMKNDYERTERNMLILRHPYLTIAQSRGHMDKEAKKTNYFYHMNDPRNERFSKRGDRFTLGERLNHLKVCEHWDL